MISLVVAALLASAALTVPRSAAAATNPAISLSASTGSPGLDVIVSGTGFSAGEKVQPVWGYSGPGTGVAQSTFFYFNPIGVADGSGAVTADFFVPDTAGGVYTVAAVGLTSHAVATAQFTVVPRLDIGSSYGSAGSVLRLSGWGLGVREPLSVTWDATGAVMATSITDSKGAFGGGTFTVPGTVAPGSYGITLKGSTSDLVAHATFQVGPAPGSPSPAPGDWATYGFTAQQTRATSAVTSGAARSALTLQWQTATAPVREVDSSVTVSNGVAYVGTVHGTLYAINASSGAVLWTFAAHGPIYGSPNIVNGVLYFGTVTVPNEGVVGNYVYALDAATGTVIWANPLPNGGAWYAPTVNAGRVIVPMANKEGQSGGVVAYTAADGTMIWNDNLLEGVWSPASFDPTGTHMYQGTGNPCTSTAPKPTDGCSGSALDIDPTTGAIRWSHRVPDLSGDDDCSTAPAYDDGMVFVGCKNGIEYAFNALTGAIVWQFDTGLTGNSGIFSSAAVANGVVYFGAGDAKIHALRETDGSQLWSYATHGAVFGSPVVAGGTVYDASSGGTLYALDLNGNLLSSYALGGASLGSPSLSDGLVLQTVKSGFVDGIESLSAGSSGPPPNQPVPDPPLGVAPHFFNGVVSQVRATGSDTTFFMMQAIADLYTGSGLYGCTLNTAAGQTLFGSGPPSNLVSTTSNLSSYCQAGANVDTTDVHDNWDRTEVAQGVDNVGSGAGQDQLCGAAPTPLPVDFARSSRPAGGACTTLVQTGYAKDGVPITVSPINPSAFGTAATAPYSGINGGVVGPVSQGWLPGDPTTGPYSGTPLTNVSNADNGGGASSTAYRIWCATGSTRITDWGALTNLGPNIVVPDAGVTRNSATVTLAGAPFASIAIGQGITGPDLPAGTTISAIGPGNQLTLSANATGTNANENPRVSIGRTLAEGDGAPIGVPVRVQGVNTASGTEATFAGFANSGVASGGCTSNMNANAGNDPDPATAPSPNAAQIALENNSEQLGQFATSNWPRDNAAAAIEVATSLYIMSNGVYNTSPYSGGTTIAGSTYASVKVNEDGASPTSGSLIANAFPTARTLFNIYRSDTVRASTGGFLNWICDSNTNFDKDTDNSTGLNFDTELGNAISSVFGFPRLTDVSTAPAVGTPADGQAAPNDSCAAHLIVSTTSGSDQVTLSGGGTFPASIVNAGGLAASSYNGGSVLVTGVGIPAGTSVVSGAGTTTLTLSNNATATGSVSVTFGGVPAVTSVAQAQS